MDIAQYGGYGGNVGRYSSLTDIEAVRIAPGVEMVSASLRFLTLPWRLAFRTHYEAASRENAGVPDKNDDLQPPVERPRLMDFRALGYRCRDHTYLQIAASYGTLEEVQASLLATM